MQQSGSRLAELGIQNLLKQRMGEVVVDRVDVVRLAEDTLRNQFVQSSDDFRFVEPGHFRQCLVGSAGTDHRRQVRERSRVLWQSIDARS